MKVKFLDETEREIADLYCADLRGADLYCADLYGANLRSADLRSADLRSANLYGANLRSADLRSADLRGANLRSADLRSANLSGADLRGANLRSADLRSANLSGADLRGANIANTILPENYRVARLDFGGWPVLVTPTHTSIGCQSHENAKWLKADKRWIAAMAEGAVDWWARHGESVKAVIKDVQA